MTDYVMGTWTYRRSIFEAIFIGNNNRPFPPEYFFRYLCRLIPRLVHNRK
jgi:hypothetical protein